MRKGMNLTGLFQYGNKNTDSKVSSGGKAGTGGYVTAGNSKQAVKGLTQGQSIHGEIVGKNGNEVQIRVDKDVVITARLDKDIPVSVGQSMTFEVKNSAGTQIALRPLFENMAQDANVLKALEAAKLPATSELMQMVSAMMKQGMSIDKNALMDMGRAVMANVGSNPETIVLMKALNLPITPENIQQFENYQNYKHQILSNVTDILMEIPKAFQSMTAAGQGDMAMDFYTRILNLAAGQAADGQAGESVNRVFTDIIGENGETVSVQGQNAVQQGQENPAVLPDGEAAGSIQKEVQAGMDRELAGMIKEGSGQGRDDAAESGTMEAVREQTRPVQSDDSFLAGILNGGSRTQLAAMLGKLGMPEGMLAQVRNGSITAELLMKGIQEMTAGQGGNINHADLMKLFGSREYTQVLTRAMEQQWLMKPEQVAEKKDVESFYRKLQTQTAQLMDALNQAGKDTPLSKSLTNMQNNLDFMNQMNQMFQYIQLPLKMSGGEAHGDLYVYANRKSAKAEDGSVSALLHLDMEHLGPMDIYVRMKDQNVSTKFYLQDEAMIDFIAEHIHLLDERLRKRGYSFQSEMVAAEETKGSVSVIETLTAQERKATLLAQYSFDVRA